MLWCVIGPVSHAFKKEVAMNGRNKILSARLGEDIIVTTSPGERSITYLGPVLRQHLLFGSIWVQPRAAGFALLNGQHVSHNHTLNNCHDSIEHMTNHKEKYPNINIVDQLWRSTISITTSPRHI